MLGQKKKMALIFKKLGRIASFWCSCHNLGRYMKLDSSRVMTVLEEAGLGLDTAGIKKDIKSVGANGIATITGSTRGDEINQQ